MSVAARGLASPTRARVEARDHGWREQGEVWHSIAIALVLASAVTLSFAHAIDGGPAAGGALLLVGGAVSGLPHGSSDFVVAHRVFAPLWGAAWLLIFGVAYLTVVALVMLCWWLAPLATLLGFLVVSGLHFGAGDLRSGEEKLLGLRWMARATTPLVPMIVCHSHVLAPYIASLGGTNEGTILHGIAVVRPVLMVVWSLSVAAVLLRDGYCLKGERSGWVAVLSIIELAGLALAAVVLPPLLTFAIYFCVIHAIRHMLDLAHRAHPRSGERACSLVMRVLIPSSLLCLIGLAITWDHVGGALSTPDLIVAALRLVAALTVPHMTLEFIAEHQRSPAVREPMRAGLACQRRWLGSPRR